MRTEATTSRRTLLAGTGAGVAAAATGCLSSGGEDSGGQDSGGNRVVWWDYYTQGGSQEAVKWALETYQQQHPEVEIERREISFADMQRTLLQGAGAGNLPDIIAVDNSNVQSLAALGVLADVTERFDSWAGSGSILPSALDTLTWNGHRYGVPDSVNCVALYYNREMLAAAAVEPPTTWDELRDAAARLTEGNRYGLAVSAIQSEEATFQFLPFLWQAGGDVAELAGPGGQDALDLWRDLVADGYMSQGILGWTQLDVLNQFMQGQTAMMVNGPWQLPALRADAPADLDWAVALLPEQQQAASTLGSEDLCITAQSQHIDAAWDLLLWLKEPANALERLKLNGKFPDDQTLLADPYFAEDPVLSVFAEQLGVARARAYGEHYPEISQHIQQAIQAAISDSSSVSQALSTAAASIEPLLADG